MRILVVKEGLALLAYAQAALARSRASFLAALVTLTPEVDPLQTSLTPPPSLAMVRLIPEFTTWFKAGEFPPKPATT